MIAIEYRAPDNIPIVLVGSWNVIAIDYMAPADIPIILTQSGQFPLWCH